jgi:hypothetical protein
MLTILFEIGEINYFSILSLWLVFSLYLLSYLCSPLIIHVYIIRKRAATELSISNYKANSRAFFLWTYSSWFRLTRCISYEYVWCIDMDISNRLSPCCIWISLETDQYFALYFIVIGDSKEEKRYMHEMTEQIHHTIFIVMIFTTLEVLGLILLASYTQNFWKTCDEICRDERQVVFKVFSDR